MSESATFATARRGRAAPATTGSRSVPRPSVRETILKPAPPRHATTGANAKRRPPQPPTTGTLLKPRPPQRDQTRLKTWFHGQQGWRRFHPHQSQGQQGRYGLHREHPPTTRAARLQPAPPLRTAAGANAKRRPPQSPNARTFTTPTPSLLAHNRPQHRLAGSRGGGSFSRTNCKSSRGGRVPVTPTARPIRQRPRLPCPRDHVRRGLPRMDLPDPSTRNEAERYP